MKLMNRVFILFISLLTLFNAQSYADSDDKAVVSEGFGVTLTADEVEREIQYLLSAQAPMGKPNLKTMERVSGEMLTNKQLLKEAEELELDKAPEVEYELVRARQRILIKARLAEFNTKNLTDAQKEILAKEYWHTNQNEFKTKAMRGLSHILISLKGRSDEEASALAQDLHGKLKQDAALFESLVEEFSDDPGSKKRKGSLGVSEGDRYVPEFSKAAFALNTVGEISEPVKSRFGYHLIRVDEIVPERLKGFDEARDVAMQKALQAYVKNKQQQHLQNLQASQNRKIYPDEIKRVWEKLFNTEE
jgi:parvulin-like peptidyl-prolyl isomerase